MQAKKVQSRNYRLKIYSLDHNANDYKLMKSLNITKHQHRTVKHLTILHCNYDKAIKSLKLQVESIDPKQIGVYFYDVNVDDGACDSKTKILASSPASETLRTDANNRSDASSSRFSIILGVLVSSVVVTFFIFFGLIAKRLFNNSKAKLFNKNCKFGKKLTKALKSPLVC
jgi:hypothetical protein